MSVEPANLMRQSVILTVEQTIIGGEAKMSIRAEGLTNPMDGAILCNKGVEFFIGQMVQAMQQAQGPAILTGN